MATLVQVVGYGWAIIGFGNLIGMFSKVHDPTWQTAGFLFNVILFILPGLGVGALGGMLKRRAKADALDKVTRSEPSSTNIGQRVERECPYCAENILARATLCKHCGREVEPLVMQR